MGEPLRIPHPVGELELSAYYDGALDHLDAGKVAEHIAYCAQCQARLEQYAHLSGVLRADEISPPADRLDARVGAILDGRRGSDSFWRAPAHPRTFVPALAATIMVILLGAYYFGLPLAGGTPFGPGGPAVAEAFPCQDAAECAVAVRFNGIVDHATIERSLQVDPPVPVVLSWQGDTLLVKPAQPLRPSQTYTVSLKVESSNLPPTRATATPIAVEILASAPGSPVAVVSPTAPPTKAHAATRTPPSLSPTAVATPPSPTSLPQVAPIVPSGPTATQAPSSTATPPPAPPTPPATATPCALSVLNPVGPTGPSAALSRLGCLLSEPTKLELIVQPFDHGRLIERPDRRQIIAAFADGTWNSYPDPSRGTLFAAAGPPTGSFEKLLQLNPKLGEALGTPIGPVARTSGSIADFERGVVVRLADREIDVFEVGAKWGAYPIESLPGAIPPGTSPTEIPAASVTTVPTGVVTPSPSASATSTPVASPTATSAATATPTSSATVSAPPSATASASATATPSSTASVCPTPTSRAVPTGTPTDPSRAGCSGPEENLSPLPLATEASPTTTATTTPHS